MVKNKKRVVNPAKFYKRGIELAKRGPAGQAVLQRMAKKSAAAEDAGKLRYDRGGGRNPSVPSQMAKQRAAEEARGTNFYGDRKPKNLVSARKAAEEEKIIERGKRGIHDYSPGTKASEKETALTPGQREAMKGPSSMRGKSGAKWERGDGEKKKFWANERRMEAARVRKYEPKSSGSRRWRNQYSEGTW